MGHLLVGAVVKDIRKVRVFLDICPLLSRLFIFLRTRNHSGALFLGEEVFLSVLSTHCRLSFLLPLLVHGRIVRWRQCSIHTVPVAANLVGTFDRLFPGGNLGEEIASGLEVPLSFPTGVGLAHVQHLVPCIGQFLLPGEQDRQVAVDSQVIVWLDRVEIEQTRMRRPMHFNVFWNPRPPFRDLSSVRHLSATSGCFAR